MNTFFYTVELLVVELFIVNLLIIELTTPTTLTGSSRIRTGTDSTSEDDERGSHLDGRATKAELSRLHDSRVIGGDDSRAPVAKSRVGRRHLGRGWGVEEDAENGGGPGEGALAGWEGLSFPYDSSKYPSSGKRTPDT